MKDIDWRIKASGKVAKDTTLFDGQVAKKGAIIEVVTEIELTKKKILTIPLPELTAIYISISEKSWAAYKKIKDNNKIDNSIKSNVTFKSNEDVFDAIENIATSVIMAYSAIESFCNDSIPKDHEYWHAKKDNIILERADKNEIERYFSTANKLNNILPEIFNVKPPIGKSPVWEGYKRIKKCRDSLIHAKTHKVRPLFNEKGGLWRELVKINKPYLLAKHIFTWYLSGIEQPPLWYREYPK